ncbi:MAG: hypothetical protein KGL59_02795 [Acidobacteriota bacterium]|nr:hypothetical protein [Acidobacteriota bacterium]
MPQTFLVFDFGTSEEAAQQARHRLEGWRQAFRLGDKLKFKFERTPAEPPAESAEPAANAPKKKTKKKKEELAAQPTAEQPSDRLRVLVLLEFSEHEKLSHQRWLDRIPTEPPFQSAEKQVVRRGQEAFEKVSEVFSELA